MTFTCKTQSTNRNPLPSANFPCTPHRGVWYWSVSFSDTVKC